MSHEIWTEKYRPQQFNEIVGQKKIIQRVESFVKENNLPHLLFSGPAGVGKTTLSLVIAKSLYGENWRQNFLELNASDNRGIDVVRNEIKNFARTKSIANIEYKTIFLDECDALTKEAQQALRRTMENYARTCRFILSCNFPSKIIDPIKSRCSICKFTPLKKEDIEKMIDRLAQKENLTINNEAKETLYDSTEGDVRKLINILQSCAATTKEITEQHVKEITQQGNTKDIQELLLLTKNKDFINARKKLSQIMLYQGLTGLDIIKAIIKELNMYDVAEEAKLTIIERCGETEFRISEGSDEYIQMEALIASIIKCS